jgi:uncharacterized protein (DUF2336 family)
VENSGKLELERIATSGMIPDKDRLAATLTELCLDPNRPPNQNELDMFFDIIRSLIHDIEMHVRKKLSEGLADRGDAPRDLVVMLANDVIEVAAPVLLQSPILQDADLIELIMERTTEHRIAISKREHLNEAVSEAFVDKGDQQALKSLLQNDGAAFSEESMQRLVDESRDEADFQELLLSRRDLPEPLAHRMYDWVSEALRRQIAAAYPGVADEIDEAVAEAVASAMESDGLEPYDDDEDWTGLPSPRSLQRALEMQDILKFEDMFQEMTGLDAATTTRVLYDMGPEGLAVACRAAGLDAEIFDDIFCHLQGSRPYTAFRKSPIYTRGMKFFERTDRQNARSIIAGWGPGG